jgi:hypothetical protein
MSSHSKMTAYRASAVGEALDQMPQATRIAGERAWKARGRRLKDGARALLVTTRPARVAWHDPVTGLPYPEAAWPCCGPQGKRLTGAVLRALPDRAAALRLRAARPVELEPARQQVVFDICDTEPIAPEPVDPDEEARVEQGLAAIARAAAQAGITFIESGRCLVGEDGALARSARETLLEKRDSGGAAVRVRVRGDGGEREVRTAIATPAGHTGVERLRVAAHEAGHALLGHLATPPMLRRLWANDHEVQAEAFAALLCQRFGLLSGSSAFYIVNRAREGKMAGGPSEALERNLGVAVEAVEGLLSQAGLGPAS